MHTKKEARIGFFWGFRIAAARLAIRAMGNRPLEASILTDVRIFFVPKSTGLLA